MTRGRLVAALVFLLVAAGAVAVGYAVLAEPQSAAPPSTPLRTGTATVTSGVATERVQVSGTLGFAGSYPVIHQGQPGVLTSVAQPGSVVEPNGVLYAVANQPTRLLLGGTPAYREFAAGMRDGPDVRQLEEGLAALGLDPRGRMAVDEHFDAATVAAIKRWETSWGMPADMRTGRLPLGRVVFLPEALRAGVARVQTGATLAPEAPVFTATSTTRVVTAEVGADRQARVHVGDGVLVSVSGLEPVPGTVAAIGQAAPARPAEPGEPAGEASSGPPTVPVTVSVQLPADAPALDEVPVRVAITTATHPDVLLVPVTALLARPGGGYQLRLVSGRFQAVQPGLFDDATGLVEVSGPGLAEGQEVRVPAP